jgi:hypothetical protein
MTLVLVLSLACAHGLSAQKAPIGFVLSLDGKWLSDGQPIQVGQELLAGSTISLPLSSATAIGAGRSITIILANSTREPHSCNTLDTCRTGFKLPASLNAPTTTWSRLGDAFHLISSKRPDRYVAALSRGGDNRTVNLRDNVLEDNVGRIEIGTLLQRVDAGRYLLRFRGIPTDGAPRGEALTIPVRWNPTHTSTVLRTRLTPGLYTVNLFPASPPDADAIGEAWILLDTPSRYAQSRAAYTEATAIADAWGPDVPERDRRLFLRACLDQLGSRIQ